MLVLSGRHLKIVLITLQGLIEKLEDINILLVLHLLLAVKSNNLNFEFNLIRKLLRIELSLALINEPVPFFDPHHDLVLVKRLTYRTLNLRNSPC